MGLWDDIVDGAESLFGGKKKEEKGMSDDEAFAVAKQDIAVVRALQDHELALGQLNNAKKRKGEAEKAAAAKRDDAYLAERQKAQTEVTKASEAFEAAKQGGDKKKEQAAQDRLSKADGAKIRLENRERWMQEHALDSFLPGYQQIKEDIAEKEAQEKAMWDRYKQLLEAKKQQVKAQASQGAAH